MLADLWPSFRSSWILHEDAHVVVVDKPADMPTHAPDAGRVDDAYARLTAFLRERGETAPYLGIHQRLDRDTSGVLLFSRSKAANPSLAKQFEGRSVDKTYVAGVTGLAGERGRGPDARDRGELRSRLVPDGEGGVRVLPESAKAGQLAVTRWRVLERRGARALVELEPQTGRTHQLRAQLAAAGSPIAGDPRYGGEVAPRLLLHATRLVLRHPITGAPLDVRSPPPPVFARWLAGAGHDALASADVVETALRDAADRRYGVARLADTDAFRIANGEGDGLPGVDVDRYGEWLVVSLSGDEATAAKERVLDAAARLGAEGVYVKVRPKHASRVVDTRRDELAPSTAVRGRDAPCPMTVHELALPLSVRLGDGLSTGVFLDQRENRRRVRELAAKGRVLNLFAYTGAFTAAAVAGGARASTTVDVSANVLAWARTNLDFVGADPAAHELVQADALPWLEQAARAGARFDLAILDPPSFATTKTSLFSAASDYRDVAAKTMALLAPGGRLLACTNHRGIVRAKLRRYLHEAARQAGRRVVQMKDLPDPVDYPPPPGREAHLKSVLVTVE